MLKETKFWLSYIVVFVFVTFFVAGLLDMAEWVMKIWWKPFNPIYLAVPIPAASWRTPGQSTCADLRMGGQNEDALHPVCLEKAKAEVSS